MANNGVNVGQSQQSKRDFNLADYRALENCITENYTKLELRDSYHTRSDICKLYVAQERIHQMTQELDRMREFLSRDLSGSKTFFPTVVSSIETAQCALREVTLDIIDELYFCGSERTGSDVASMDINGFPNAMIVRVPDEWVDGHPVTFKVDQVQYEAIPPSACKPGDSMRFNPITRILSKV